MNIRTSIILAILALLGAAAIMSCSDSKQLRQPQCLDIVKSVVPVPLHVGRLSDGGAVIIGFETILVVATKPIVEFGLDEELEKNGLKQTGVCYANLPSSQSEQEYQVYQKLLQKPE